MIIPKRRAVGLTATVARTSAGALNYTPVAQCDQSEEDGRRSEESRDCGSYVQIWMVTVMYDLDLKGPIGLVIGNEGEGVSQLDERKLRFCCRHPDER